MIILRPAQPTQSRFNKRGLHQPRSRRRAGGRRAPSLFSKLKVRFSLAFVLSLSLLSGGCFESEQGEQFYGSVVVPRAQEFRWSDGGLPRVFDPARAAAPPDTDVIRALFEGLTDYDPATLRPVPAVASRWESTDGARQWTFHLRRDAFWSNGDRVTARDFVRSWQRTLRLGEGAPHAKLLSNIEGARTLLSPPSTQATGAGEALSPTPSPEAEGTAAAAVEEVKTETAKETETAPAFGAEALDEHTLRVNLRRPDRSFPALVAHPVFRPYHELSPTSDLAALQTEQRNRGAGEGALGIVTNGAFNLSELGSESVVLERSRNYWDSSSVKLERVLFVAKRDAEDALAAYRAGEVDAVTNASFESLALKLLTPYKDFRRRTFGALTYYQFNTSRAPFDDPRVREALAVSLDLERLSADTLGGATEPARRFLPFGVEEAARSDSAEASAGESEGAPHTEEKKEQDEERVEPVRHNVERARRLLAEAGFPGGENFPRVRLVVNRNEQQRIVAQEVARAWRGALGVETEIIVRNWEEYEALIKAGDYDVARKSVVMQSVDEESNMLALFGEDAPAPETATPLVSETPNADATTIATNSTAAGQAESSAPPPALPVNPKTILSEAQALRELPAIPIYFASSYALVKPYVNGFETNLLDAPSLKNVSLDTGWKPPEKRTVRIARIETR
ncbi:MAG TPA: peptide ABC transporter substrate-binding protein [Pyrinomonadaceae bacterium]|nr:peptide ABC transporter substrate-binding protein [Pyrinomonadaceae bacterium]